MQIVNIKKKNTDIIKKFSEDIPVCEVFIFKSTFL